MITNPHEVRIRVLVVDDERQVGMLLCEFLAANGYEVFYSDNGEDALTFIKRARPHLTLLDVRMFEMDGLEVLRRIRKIDPQVGVIMVTATRDEEVGRMALKLGAADYITKPIDFEYLETSLRIKLSALLD